MTLPVNLSRLLGVFTFVLFALLSACGQTPQAVTLRSLESSGRMSFVCLGRNFAPRSIEDCPDLNVVDDEDRHLYSLVTQKNRGEVAVVDLTAGGVVDEEPNMLGFNFLQVGLAPTSIVSTPGGVATFVGVAETGKEGIFAIPSSCVGPREGNEPVRDITTWPSCRLPSAPGDMALLLDEARDTACGGDVVTAVPRAECPADLSLEMKPPGRRKLAVALPGRGTIAVLDAQEILNRKPGSFTNCVFTEYPFRVDLPGKPVVPRLPADLDVPGFTFPEPRQYEPTVLAESRPGGFAQVDDRKTGEHRLFVADVQAPVIHELDTSDPCRLQERPPLLPVSLVDLRNDAKNLGRVVITSKVAASPLTTDGKRYLYAIDDLDPGGASVMVFDVSQGATERTPLVRKNAARFPFEAPDRIAFDTPTRDVTFALRDTVITDPSTGAAPVGILCDPDPALDPELPAAQYRPLPDFSSGANARNLRGVFGFLALSSGQIAVIDVEDFDAKCRRPKTTNTSPVPDFRGCANDTLTGDLVVNVTPTVTDEATCNVVEQHRSRSGNLIVNNSDQGTRAPALRAFPKLVDKNGRSLPVDRTTEGVKNPRMLGVNFGPGVQGRAKVWVGTTPLTSDGDKKGLVIDPTLSEENSLVLSFVEPRSYAGAETFSARYEGVILGERPAASFLNLGGGLGKLVDGGLVFCSAGIEDSRTSGLRGSTLGVKDPADIALFGEQHADFAVITSELVDENDAYWSHAGAACAGGGGFLECRSLFGTRGEGQTPYRELRIVDATVDTLTVEPRSAPHQSRKGESLSERIACCFPEAVSYEVRASAEWVLRGAGFRHNVVTNTADKHCTLDPSPLKALLPSRVVEVSCDRTSAACIGPDGATSIGIANAKADSPTRDVACVVQDPRRDTQTIGDSPCVYSGLSGSFVIYRGRAPSTRDMEFGWEVRGGFIPLSVSLAGADPNSNPESMVFSPELGELVIADGSSKGLVLLDLGTFGQTPFY